MIKYKHKETGLFLTKRKYGYSSVYRLTTKGTTWPKNVIKTLSMTKDPRVYGYDQYFEEKEFDIVKHQLIEI